MKKIQIIIFLALLVCMSQSLTAQEISREEFQWVMKENVEKRMKVAELQKEILAKEDSIRFVQQELERKKVRLDSMIAHSASLEDFEKRAAASLMNNNSGILQRSLDLLVSEEMESLSRECGRYSVAEVMEFKDRLDVLIEIKQVYDEMKALCYDEFNVSELMRLNDLYSGLTLDSLTQEQRTSIDRMKYVMDDSVEAIQELHLMVDGISYYISMYSNVSHSTAWDMIKSEYDAAVKDHIMSVPSLRRLSDRVYQDLKKNAIVKPDVFAVISVLYDDCVNNNLIAR